MQLSDSSITKHKAIALMSGGLDSNLAVRIIHDMGIEVIGVHFTGPFCMCNRGAGGCIHYANKIAGELGISFSTIGLGNEYLEHVVNPKHGRGSGMNACLDCRILMFEKAKVLMAEKGASFILTGEVLGQRPMSKLRDKLAIIERETSLQGLILRPLSAQHFPPTLPEKEGWIDRDALLDIHGRGRRPQMDLAEKLHLGDYPCPAGGCLLTDKNFAARLREHIDHTGGLQMADIALLKLGRHFRLPSGAMLILGRNEEECKQVERHAGKEGVLLLVPENVPGPSALLSGANGDSETRTLAAKIVATYCNVQSDVIVGATASGETYSITASGAQRDDFAEMKC